MKYILPAIALILSSCSTISPAKLEGKWVFEQITGLDQQISQKPTLNFDSNRVSGNSGCNNYGGEFKQMGDKLSFGPIAQTKMACLEDNKMQTENAFGQMISKVASYKITNSELAFFDQNGAQIARLSKVN